MSEYIVNTDEWLSMRSEYINGRNFERIVRCRDCKQYLDDQRGGKFCARLGRSDKVFPPDGHCSLGELRGKRIVETKPNLGESGGCSADDSTVVNEMNGEHQ